MSLDPVGVEFLRRQSERRARTDTNSTLSGSAVMVVAIPGALPPAIIFIPCGDQGGLCRRLFLQPPALGATRRVNTQALAIIQWGRKFKESLLKVKG